MVAFMLFNLVKVIKATNFLGRVIKCHDFLSSIMEREREKSRSRKIIIEQRLITTSPASATQHYPQNIKFSQRFQGRLTSIKSFLNGLLKYKKPLFAITRLVVTSPRCWQADSKPTASVFNLLQIPNVQNQYLSSYICTPLILFLIAVVMRYLVNFELRLGDVNGVSLIS